MEERQLDGFLVLPGMADLTLLTNWVSCAAQILKQEARHVCAWRAMKWRVSFSFSCSFPFFLLHMLFHRAYWTSQRKEQEHLALCSYEQVLRVPSMQHQDAVWLGDTITAPIYNHSLETRFQQEMCASSSAILRRPGSWKSQNSMARLPEEDLPLCLGKPEILQACRASANVR